MMTAYEQLTDGEREWVDATLRGEDPGQAPSCRCPAALAERQCAAAKSREPGRRPLPRFQRFTGSGPDSDDGSGWVGPRHRRIRGAVIA